MGAAVLLAGVLAVVPVEAPRPATAWRVETVDIPYGVCRWRVSYGRRPYGRYNSPEMARAVADELARRGYGRKFPVSGEEFDAIFAAACKRTREDGR